MTYEVSFSAMNRWNPLELEAFLSTMENGSAIVNRVARTRWTLTMEVVSEECDEDSAFENWLESLHRVERWRRVSDGLKGPRASVPEQLEESRALLRSLSDMFRILPAGGQ